MLSWLYNYWQILKTSLWLVPATFCFFYFLSVVTLYEIEIRYFGSLNLPEIFFAGSASDAKILSTSLLSSMITMATLAISITIVALTLAASQLGPRIIKIFMSNRRTQIFMGLFFGVVVACFTLVLALYDVESADVNPKITISVVLALCFANLFVLLAFVNHVAQSIIADNVITNVSRDLKSALSRLTYTKVSHFKDDDESDENWPENFDEDALKININKSGYIQNIDYEQIARCAKKDDAFVDVVVRSGHFLVNGEVIYRVLCAQNTVQESFQTSLKNSVIIGNTRTPTQDIEYSIRHLVEIATRALSPGINDTFTAITVLDYLSQALAELFEKEIPNPWIKDCEGIVRVRVKRISERDIIMSAFNQIRHEGRHKPVILGHILKKLDTLKNLIKSEQQKNAIKCLLDDLSVDIDQLNDQSHEHEHLKEYLEMILRRD